jgi:hypothetical protein
VQEEHWRFILVQAKKWPTSSGEVSSVLSCTEVIVVGVTSGCERGMGSQVSRCEWRKLVCATLLVTSQGPGEFLARVLCCVAAVVLFSSSFCPLERSLHAPFIVLRRCRVTKCWCAVCPLLEEEPGGLERALSGGDVVCTVEAWRRYFWHYSYMCQVCAPLLEEWSLSFGIVATCPVIPGPVASVAYLSL